MKLIAPYTGGVVEASGPAAERLKAAGYKPVVAEKPAKGEKAPAKSKRKAK